MQIEVSLTMHPCATVTQGLNGEHSSSDRDHFSVRENGHLNETHLFPTHLRADCDRGIPSAASGLLSEPVGMEWSVRDLL